MRLINMDCISHYYLPGVIKYLKTNGEPIYEEHPVCFNAKENGYTDAYDVRKAVYLSMFAGALGVTYGCHAVWQFYQPPASGINGPVRPWKESLQLDGANQVGFLKQ